jgi:low affinity Fe/Cu permease
MAHKRRPLESMARLVTAWTGSSTAFAIAVLVVLVWSLTGPIFHFSNTWQLVINTGTTIVTFLMVFLIQRAQNKDSLAVHLKLNELVAAMEGASNRLISVEHLSEEDIRVLSGYFHELAELASKDESLTASRSIEQARDHHTRKTRRRKKAADTADQAGNGV